MNLIEFTDCHKVFGKAYNGAKLLLPAFVQAGGQL